MTKQELLVLQGTDPCYLTGDQLSGLTRDQLSGLTRDQLSGLTGDQKGVPVLKNPYTAVRDAIKKEGCALNMKTWHTCETTHCLGGWIVTLAKATALEKTFDTEGAARLILRNSRPEAPLPNFYASDDAAMAFIEARAAEEK